MREQSRSDEDLGVRYLRMALEYGRATRALLDGNQCEAPFWQSMGHALELSLKSLLKKHGFDEMDLMHFISHDLYGAERSYLRQCPDSQLISADASRLIRHLSDYHARLDFRYPCLFPAASLPDPADAERALAAHLTAVAGHFGVTTHDRS
ncbi:MULTISPECIES: hypothetical protein [Sphingomonadaceae]|uniref:hypothetical protein n=1 Tax=Sphingomonadaceae TaxID=41297 RepID=UPI001158EDFB|nr:MULTISPECIES: hypothetical protein [Sphingomonadaceae]GFE77368.1 hypothetical protein NTCA1_50170 [Novosphingobium sp. TCA1]